MHVLIAVASKHGATYGMGAEIARVLHEAGLRAELARIGDPDGLDDYDAVVIGSAVYMGHWLPEAVAFIERHVVELANKPVWLFSSGPVGDPPKGSLDQGQLDRLLVDSGARGHEMFAGCIDPGDLTLKEKVVTSVVRAPSGDYRDWGAIEAWAKGIAAALAGATTAS